MIPPEAIEGFRDKQKRLLRRTYDAAWATGVGSYQPDADPDQEPDTARDAALAGLTGAALLAARRAYRYEAPVQPDPIRRAVALAPAFSGVDSMAAELSTLAANASGDIGAAADSFRQSLLDYIDNNGWRLDAGDSVVWAGEQNGYGEAADADGQLLEWQDEGDDRVCGDCNTLGQMPPMALSDWPAQPGDGSTECNVGCRCSLEASPVSVQPGDIYTPQLSDEQEATISKLVDAQAQALADAVPDAAYLDSAMAESRRMREDFNPDEPRDDHGEWTGGGSATYYHVTASANDSPIASGGLKAEGPGVWLHGSLSDARDYAEGNRQMSGETQSIYKVSVDPSNVQQAGAMFAGGSAAVHSGDIPASSVTKIE